MCGRYTYATEFRDIRIRFDLEKDIPLFKPRYNIAPGQEAGVIVREEGARTGKMMRWGFGVQ